ncbi:prolyl oligopeptidase family serine peptidase [Porticoccaceae bacterium]|nr:prolyl oligopeptidase family serine peptidase [Porticoccaceae bacterium]
MTQLKYPPTRTVNIKESHAGVEFIDPYRWLEEDTDEVHRWQTSQGQLAADYVREWHSFEAVKGSVEHFLVDRVTTVPHYVGDKWFRIDKMKGATQISVVVSDTPYGNGRILFDPSYENTKNPPFLSWISPSPDGRILAVGVCADGSENNTIRLVDVDTGGLLQDPPLQVLMDSWTGGVCWLPDSSAFYFLALEGEKQDFRKHILYHRLVDGTQAHVEIPLSNLDPQEYMLVTVDSQGRYLVANYGLITPRPIALRDLNVPDSNWRPFITSEVGAVAGHVVDNYFIAITDVYAPRGRIVAIPLDTENPNDPVNWTELVPESEAVLRSITPVGEWIYVTELVDTYSRIRIFDRTGKPIGEVPLPGKGAVTEQPFHMVNLIPKGHPDEYLFAFSTLTESWGVYRHRLGENVIETLQSPQVKIENAIVEDHWATSSDGTKIPYHIVFLTDIDYSKPQPTLIYAYGGYNVPWLPQFPGAMAAFVAAGGVYVHGHLRGGAEFGLDWWQAGRMENKPNCYKDLYAIAEDLIGNGQTTSQKLAMTGASNGGLMAGVALTQRPDLWKVVVPRVPVLDLMGACRHFYGRHAIEIEYGNPDDPEAIRRMAGYSPYHLIKDGSKYPAVFIDAGDTDPRCPPWHARKFGARMQAANEGDTAVLIRIWENVGHGCATARDIQILEYAEWLSFVMWHLDMKL